MTFRNTKPYTPKTNGMVERVNGTIKNGTIKSNKYQNYEELEVDLNKFLIYYNFNRSHGSLRKELNVRTPFDALEKWYKLSRSAPTTLLATSPHICYNIPHGIHQWKINRRYIHPQ